MDVTEAPIRSIQLVVFDLGRVLVRICSGWQQACDCAGVKLPENGIDPASLPRLREIVHAAEIGQIGADGFAQQTAPLLGLRPGDVHALSEAYIFGPYPGAIELLEELALAGVRTACLSNTNEHHWRLLSQFGHRAFFPLDRLNHRFASHLVRARKPQEEIYAKVELETGISGGAVLFFDDLPENIEAAQRRGWTGVRIDPALDEPIGQIRWALRQYRVNG